MHVMESGLSTGPVTGPPAAGPAPAVPFDGLATAILEATAALVLVCDGAGRILLANPALQQFTGRSREELHGALMYDVVVQPQEIEIARVGVAAVYAGEPAIPGEVDWLNGEVVALARSLGREAPVNAAIVALVKQAEQGGRRNWPAADLAAAVLGSRAKFPER